MKKNPRSDCPISYALDFLGDKWSLLIIRDMIFDGKRFYKEFLNSKEKIATNILSDRLKRLESIGLVQSKVDPDQKRQKIYTLTEKGIDLVPTLVDIIVWSAKHHKGLAVPKGFINKVKNNRTELINNIRHQIITN